MFSEGEVGGVERDAVLGGMGQTHTEQPGWIDLQPGPAPRPSLPAQLKPQPHSLALWSFLPGAGVGELPAKGQLVKVFGFAGRTASVATIQLCRHKEKDVKKRASLCSNKTLFTNKCHGPNLAVGLHLLTLVLGFFLSQISPGQQPHRFPFV